MIEYEEIPPIDLDIESIAIPMLGIESAPSGFTNGSVTNISVAVTQKDKSVVVLACKPGVRLCSGKRQRALFDPFGVVSMVYDLDENNNFIPYTNWPK